MTRFNISIAAGRSPRLASSSARSIIAATLVGSAAGLAALAGAPLLGASGGVAACAGALLAGAPVSFAFTRENHDIVPSSSQDTPPGATLAAVITGGSRYAGLRTEMPE